MTAVPPICPLANFLQAGRLRRNTSGALDSCHANMPTEFFFFFLSPQTSTACTRPGWRCGQLARQFVDKQLIVYGDLTGTRVVGGALDSHAADLSTRVVVGPRARLTLY